MWADSKEVPRPRVLQAVSSPIPGRKPPRVYDFTEVNSEDDSDRDWGPDVRVFDPVETDDELDNVIDAPQQDLEDGVGPAVQPTMEDAEEATPRFDRQDILVGAMVRPRSRSVETPDQSCVVSVSRACASAPQEGRVAIFARRGCGSFQGSHRRPWNPSWPQMSKGRPLCQSSHRWTAQRHSGERRRCPCKSWHQAASGSCCR